MPEKNEGQEHHATISGFIEQAGGLDLKLGPAGELNILQQADGKSIHVASDHVEDVLTRLDSNGESFLQVNFMDGRKILITDRLIGFKPVNSGGLDVQKLPKVVTTPDLVSVLEAIEESMSSDENDEQELQLLKKVFDSVLAGGEAVGFDLSREKAWVGCIVAPKTRAAN